MREWAFYLFAGFTLLGLLSVVVTEILREIVDRKRRNQTGIGGTQDIAIYGLLCLGCSVCGAIISLVVWLFLRF